MEVIYRGFDGLDVAFQGHIPAELDACLEEAKTQASKRMQSVLIEYQGVKMHVGETGMKGGYAYLCDTGPDGATWFFKRPNRKDPWGIRVSVKSLALALYGLGGVRKRLYEFLDGIGVRTTPHGVSIGRVDYAVDVLAPGFVLVPDNFVMHSHCTRADHIEPEPTQVHGRSGRVTSVTVGKMPGRQVIVYDKRADVIAKQKVEWWEIWNANRRAAGKPELDRKDSNSSQIWRVELRAGKKHLNDRWGIKTWADLDEKLGDLFERMANDIRYTQPSSDTNRARWQDDPIWNLLRSEIAGDLFELTTGAEPGVVKEIMRDHLDAILTAQVVGLAATLSHVRGLASDDAGAIAQLLAQSVQESASKDTAAFEAKRQRAAERYCFID